MTELNSPESVQLARVIGYIMISWYFTLRISYFLFKRSKKDENSNQ